MRVDPVVKITEVPRITAARRDVVVRVHNTLVSTSPEDAKLFEAVIMDQRAERALMDATFGDPQVVNDDNVLGLLATIRRATAEEITIEKNAEIERIVAERDRASSALREQTMELENVRRGIELSKSMAIAEDQKLLRKDRATARRCFDKACIVYKWSGAAVGILLSTIALLAQVLVPDAMKAASVNSWLARIAKSWWVPGVVFFIPTLLGMYEVPDMIFSSVRRRFADGMFSLLLRWNGVGHVVSDGLWDYRVRSLTFGNPT